MKKLNIIYTIVAIALFTITCKTPYTPPDTGINTNWLVVEGNINTGNDSTIFKLSRTVKLNASNALKPELNAVVTVESNTNNVYTLVQKGGGVYFATPLGLDPNKQYRLRIRASNGTQYLSDYVTPKVTPPIDEMPFTADDDYLKIFVNTHDPLDKARYYKWDFEETYEFHSPMSTFYKSDGKQIVSRTAADENITVCWKTLYSTSIVLNSTVKLSKDVVKDQLVTAISSSLEKTSVKYSMLLKQYALNKDAFEFWERLKKNTEQVGSIFDAQPSLLQSNIHNLSNPAEPVVGYVTACNVTSKRIFITPLQLPAIYGRPRFVCQPDTFLLFNPETGRNEVNDMLIPKLALPSDQVIHETTGRLLGYSGSVGGICIDCTLKGSNKRPPFWQ